MTMPPPTASSLPIAAREESPSTRPASFVLADPTGSLEGRGIRRVISDSVEAGLTGTASRAVQAEGQGILVGALPFDSRSPAHLVLPVEARHSSRQLASSSDRRHTADAPWRITERPTRERYCAAVTEALARLTSADDARPGSLTKVVLARTLELEAPAPIDPVAVFRRLLADRSATAFCVPLAPRADGLARTFVGATPELLLERRGTAVTSLPMAGSSPRQADPGADQDAARLLAASAKDQHEHRIVVEHVLDCLAPHCRRLNAPRTPVLTSTSTMWHLATPVEGELKRDISSLELAVALHPTPAVCGSPGNEARQLIEQLEPFDRGYFAGAVGWCDSSGDGRWMVAIRCAEIAGTLARLYAGAGIVAESDPESEAAETSAKFRTLLRALGVDEHGQPAARVEQ